MKKTIAIAGIGILLVTFNFLMWKQQHKYEEKSELHKKALIARKEVEKDIFNLDKSLLEKYNTAVGLERKQYEEMESEQFKYVALVILFLISLATVFQIAVITRK